MKSYPILVSLIIALLAGTAAEAKYSGGTGTPNDPYRIATPKNLRDIGKNHKDWEKNFILIKNINISQYNGTRFRMIGRYTGLSKPDDKPFTGVFDGNGHKILNFTWNSTARNYIGLFGYVGEGGQIKNLGIENANVTSVGGNYVGILVGFNEGTITNCYSIGSISKTRRTVGGLVGFNSGAITNCYSSTDISGEYYTGGLVGENWQGTISNCHSTGTVKGAENVGGLAGYSSGTITNCYSRGIISGTDSVGGLVGIGSTILNSYSLSTVAGNTDVGGLIGRTLGDTIDSCYSLCTVSGQHYIGGLVGYNGSGFITKCHSSSIISGDAYVGGLVGDNCKGIITNCYSTNSISGNSSVGGLVGKNGGTLRDCYSKGNVCGIDSIGGLVGCNSSSNRCGPGWCIIELHYGLIYNSYSTGSVLGTSRVGGLIGGGRLLGESQDIVGTIVNSVWDIQSSDCNTSHGGIGKTTEEMKTKSTFTDASWDFVNIWDICEGTNYPRLRWQIPLAISIGDFVCSYGVDFMDFTVMASAWQSEPNDPDWNPACDISQPKDNFIDELDLAVFCENWLEGPP